MPLNKIITQEEKNKKQERNKLIVGIVLVIVMIIGTAGTAFISKDSNSQSQITYNGIKFLLQEDGLWHATINGVEITTFHNPKEVEGLMIPFQTNIQDFQGLKLYYVYDSNYQGIAEIDRNIGRLSEKAQYACTSDCDADWPIKSCAEENIISIKIGNETKADKKSKCIYLEAKAEDITKLADSFVFKSFGVF